MPFQTTKTDKYIFPDGVALGVSTDNGVSFSDFGVFEGGVSLTHNYDKVELESGNAGKLFARAKNETLAVAPTTLWTWDLEALQKASGSLFTYTAEAGTPVAGASQVTASGSWAFNKFIKIANQNFDGSAITVNSVTAATDGLLVADTDYYVGQNASGEYGIFIIDSATVTVEAQDITIDYDYTPAASYTLTSGKSSTTLSRSIMRLRHYTDDALTTYDMETIIYGVDIDAGLAMNFDGANSDTVNGITVSFTANIDSSQTSGAQLFSMLIKDSAYTSS